MQGFPWWFHIKNHLPIQDTWVQSLVQKMPHAMKQLGLCTATLKPVL